MSDRWATVSYIGGVPYAVAVRTIREQTKRTVARFMCQHPRVKIISNRMKWVKPKDFGKLFNPPLPASFKIVGVRTIVLDRPVRHSKLRKLGMARRR